MAKFLVIAEKPSVAQSLAKILSAYQREDGYLVGNSCIVSWCLGHLAEYAPPEIYDEKYQRQYIGGYSLGGLFALFAACEKELFDGVMSVSGSLWYPGALEYFNEKSIGKRIGKIYMSLGDKESLTKNVEREKVGFNTEKLAEVFGRTKEVFFEYNRGGHFTDISERIAKSILTEIS